MGSTLLKGSPRYKGIFDSADELPGPKKKIGNVGGPLSGCLQSVMGLSARDLVYTGKTRFFWASVLSREGSIPFLDRMELGGNTRQTS